jgi:2-polyprenyl-6-methoxyphenol hydroxylase-like FAD-dependent oxidoreductase
VIDQGQGGGQAIEDAASLAVLLGRGTPREELPERLKLYEKCRKERADRIQQYTRMAGRDATEIAKSGQQLNSECRESMSKKPRRYADFSQ